MVPFLPAGMQGKILARVGKLLHPHTGVGTGAINLFSKLTLWGWLLVSCPENLVNVCLFTERMAGIPGRYHEYQPT
jgi:hypothetical protein